MSFPPLPSMFVAALRPCLALCLVVIALAPVHAADRKAAESAALALTADSQQDGYAFRAESWTRDLSPDLGRAVRVQLFKGNDYRFCIAVPSDSGVRITATVLDFEGKPRGDIKPLEEGWGLILSFKPRKTGSYVIAIRQTAEGKSTKVPCSVITGYR